MRWKEFRTPILISIIASAATLYPSLAQSASQNTVYSFTGFSDGSGPQAGMTAVNGVLYGTTLYGGTGKCSSPFGVGCGTVFSFDPSTKQEKVVYSFAGSADGELPYAGLIYVNGMLYGTTYQGGGGGTCPGDNGCGTVFSINPSTGAETVVYAFQSNAPDGRFPFGALVAPNNNELFGTTTRGGTGTCSNEGCGTVFEINLSTGAESVVHSFLNNGTDGVYPTSDWAMSHGVLYNTTSEGGIYGLGTIFSISTTTGIETILGSGTV